MAAEIKELDERKRQLLARSEYCRQTMVMQVRDLKTATAWVPHTVRVVRTAYPIILLAVPFLSYLFARKRSHRPAVAVESSRRRGVIASALAGYKFFRQMKPVLDGLRSRF